MYLDDMTICGVLNEIFTLEVDYLQTKIDEIIKHTSDFLIEIEGNKV